MFGDTRDKAGFGGMFLEWVNVVIMEDVCLQRKSGFLG